MKMNIDGYLSNQEHDHKLFIEDVTFKLKSSDLNDEAKENILEGIEQYMRELRFLVSSIKHNMELWEREKKTLAENSLEKHLLKSIAGTAFLMRGTMPETTILETIRSSLKEAGYLDEINKERTK